MSRVTSYLTNLIARKALLTLGEWFNLPRYRLISSHMTTKDALGLLYWGRWPSCQAVLPCVCKTSKHGRTSTCETSWAFRNYRTRRRCICTVHLLLVICWGLDRLADLCGCLRCTNQRPFGPSSVFDHSSCKSSCAVLPFLVFRELLGERRV